jgi:hypothetical protein
MTTTQLPQQPAFVFVRAVVGSRGQAGGYFHARSELITTRLARRRFLIRPFRLGRWTTPQRYCSYNAFERNGAAGKGDGVAGFDPVRRLHTLAIQVDFTATDCIARGGTGLEQADCKQPAVNPRGARPGLLSCTHGRKV